MAEIVFLKYDFKAYCSWNLTAVPRGLGNEIVFYSFSQLLVKPMVVKHMEWLPLQAPQTVLWYQCKAADSIWMCREIPVSCSV